MASIKRVYDPRIGSYDVLVGTPNAAVKTITYAAGTTTASLGETNFVLSASAAVVALPAIASDTVGSTVKLLSDSAFTVTASNPFVSPAGTLSAVIGAFSASNYVSVSGSAGYYWHVS
jgi:hypothetical protein